MRKAVPLLCGLTSAGVAFAAALILFGSCSPRGSGKVDFRDSCTRIDSLRVTGRYEEALEAAVRLDSFMSQGHGRAWQREDAHRLAGTLRRIASLPAAGRRDMAEADSLTPVIERLITVDEDYVAAMNTAARQLELRSRRLGPADPDVAASLHLLGRIANQSGEGQRCEEYLQKALAIRRAQFGPRHPLVAETLREWGILMKTRLELPKAE